MQHWRQATLDIGETRDILTKKPTVQMLMFKIEKIVEVEFCY